MMRDALRGDTSDSDARVNGYELLDFGRGRKLERFGQVVLDRICPAADGLQPRLDKWESTARLDGRGRIVGGEELVDEWRVELAGIHFTLKLTPFGHVGLFPEQAENWDWIASWCRDFSASGQPPNVLNLFAYTGGSTLAAAKAGAQVTHVDASKPAVTWARRNADMNGLGDAPVRWIVEDAQKYLGRELRRGNRYDLIILDPPSYGHGPQGKRWELGENAADLLQLCRDLLGPSSRDKTEGKPCLLFTAHSAEPTDEELCELAERVWGSRMTLRRMQIRDATGRAMDAGFCIQPEC
ncbi:MAG: class I SAM-dependent methyltransferase [Aureliella sp.]